MLTSLYSQLFLLPVVLAGILAFAKGDEPERIGMGAYLLGWLAAMLIQDSAGMHSHFQPGLFALDFIMLMVFGGIAWKYSRSWPIWAASLQLIALMSHFVILFDLRPTIWAFYAVLNLASYGILVCIGIGSFWAWQERRAAGLE
ncbi:hypothetical protein [Brevundimonas sp. R86498]|uniref:hypothetical protein n=1 Tax=Brevundimonas sp. R86498 TaxID=3093845 RepID=UPI0037C7523F